MTVWGQYLSYLIAGILYYFMLAAFFSVASGFSIWAIVLVLLAAVLGGYVPGLSLVAPRFAAIAGGIIALVFLLYCIAGVFSEPGGLSYGVIALPALVAVAVSVAAFRGKDGSLWLRQSGAGGKLGVGVLIAIPALLATWVMVHILSRLILW